MSREQHLVLLQAVHPVIPPRGTPSPTQSSVVQEVSSPGADWGMALVSTSAGSHRLTPLGCFHSGEQREAK